MPVVAIKPKTAAAVVVPKTSLASALGIGKSHVQIESVKIIVVESEEVLLRAQFTPPSGPHVVARFHFRPDCDKIYV